MVIAEEEWDSLNRDLVKMIGTVADTELLAAGPLIATGGAGFFAAASAIGMGTGYAVDYMRRRRFPLKYPASFFMDIKE